MDVDHLAYSAWVESQADLLAQRGFYLRKTGRDFVHAHIRARTGMPTTILLAPSGDKLADLRGDGQNGSGPSYLAAEPTIHPVTGRRYTTLAGGPENVSEVDDALRAFLVLANVYLRQTGQAEGAYTTAKGRAGAIAVPVELPDGLDELPRVDVSQLNVTSWCKRLIVEGGALDPSRYDDRSGPMWRVECEMVEGGCSDAQLAAVLLDPNNAVGDKARQKGWSWLRGEIARARFKASPPSDLPVLDAAELDLRVITPKAWSALAQANRREMRLFRHGGVPARIEPDDKGHPMLRELTSDRARHELVRAVRFTVSSRGGQKVVLPPHHVVADMLATPDPPLPVLARIVECPTFAPSGALQTTSGYHARSQTYVDLPEVLEDLQVPNAPTAEDVEEAKRWILDELLGDFPFVGQADRANAVGLGILTFVRDMIPDPTPLHLFEAPVPGSGKGLCAAAVLRPSCGRNIGAIAQCADEAEWRKSITTLLMSGHAAVQIDNLSQPLASGALSAALTLNEWTDRLLGVNQKVTVPVRCVWVTTGNNPTLSTEMARRTIRIRLDPGVERPWDFDEKDFRHPELLVWADQHRRELVRAFLVLAQAWIAAGRPAWRGRALGSYESWSHTIGGILEHAGIDGFMGNLREFYEIADTEMATRRAFVQAWWDKYGTAEVRTANLLAQALATDVDLGSGGVHSQQVRLGKFVAELRDRVFGSLRVVQSGWDQRAARWRLLLLQEAQSQLEDRNDGQ
jgi:hypothetical protein